MLCIHVPCTKVTNIQSNTIEKRRKITAQPRKKEREKSPHKPIRFFKDSHAHPEKSCNFAPTKRKDAGVVDRAALEMR